MRTVNQKDLDRKTIKNILPHRGKWLLLDEILELNDGTAKAVKAFTEEDCKGHFPAPLGPVVPGHLVAEALAQTGGLILGFQESKDNKIPLLIETLLKFRGLVYPNQEVVLKAEIEKQKLGITFFKVRALVNGKLVVKGKIGVVIKEK